MHWSWTAKEGGAGGRLWYDSVREELLVLNARGDFLLASVLFLEWFFTKTHKSSIRSLYCCRCIFTYIVKFSLILSTVTTSLSRVRKEIFFWDKYIENWNMSDHYPKKTNLMKTKFYLLFARLKKTYVTNEFKRTREIVDNSV